MPLPYDLPFFLGDDATGVAITVDHIATGLSRLDLQYRSQNPDDPSARTPIEVLLAILLKPFNDLEFVLQQLLQLRSIYTAEGVYLDAIGKLLQQPRGTLLDEDYRRYLFARIATNRADGRRRTLIKIAKLIISDPAAKVVVTNRGPAGVLMEIEGVLAGDTLAGILITFLRDAVAAGYRITLVSSPTVQADQFALARATNAPAGLTSGSTSATVADTAGFPPIGTVLIDASTAVAEAVDYTVAGPTVLTLLAPLAHNHSARACVQIVDATRGKGLGSIDEPGQPSLTPYSPAGTTGGRLRDARE